MTVKKPPPKQKRFVEEYLIDLCATQAAIRAGYSKKTAKSQGQRLLTNVDVAALIKKAQDKRSARNEVTLDEITNHVRKAIKIATAQEKSGELSRAAMDLAKLHGQIIDKHEHSGPNGGPIQTEFKTDLSKVSDKDLATIEKILTKFK